MSRLTYIDALGTGQIKGLQLLGCKWACDNSKSCENCLVGKAITKLADYEDLEEQGLLLRLPAAMGTTVYFKPANTNRVIECVVTDIHLNKDNRSFIEVRDEKRNVYGIALIKFNEIVSVSREKAEQKLKEMEG